MLRHGHFGDLSASRNEDFPTFVNNPCPSSRQNPVPRKALSEKISKNPVVKQGGCVKFNSFRTASSLAHSTMPSRSFLIVLWSVSSMREIQIIPWSHKHTWSESHDGHETQDRCIQHSLVGLLWCWPIICSSSHVGKRSTTRHAIVNDVKDSIWKDPRSLAYCRGGGLCFTAMGCSLALWTRSTGSLSLEIAIFHVHD